MLYTTRDEAIEDLIRTPLAGSVSENVVQQVADKVIVEREGKYTQNVTADEFWEIVADVAGRQMS